MRERMAKGLSAEPRAGFRAYVGNLPFQATEAELEDLFAECAHVVKRVAATPSSGLRLPGSELLS